MDFVMDRDVIRATFVGVNIDVRRRDGLCMFGFEQVGGIVYGGLPLAGESG